MLSGSTDPRRPARPAASIVLLALVVGGLSVVSTAGCDAPPADEPETEPPAPCQTAGCRLGLVCRPDGRCASPEEIGGGAAACSALVDCTAACPTQTCVNACFANASGEAVARYDSIASCLSDNGCFNEEGQLDEACLRASCEPEYEACFGRLPARPEGTGRCGRFVRCINSCPFDPPEASQACVDSCVETTSAEGFDLYLAAVDCIGMSGCEPGDGACQEMVCGEALGACFDHGLGVGSLYCDDVLDCAYSCFDFECYERCEVDASAEALELWRAFVDCAISTGCGGVEGCLPVCPEQTRACTTHGLRGP